MKSTPRTAWLITRGNGVHPQTEIIDILSARISSKYVKEYVERLHCITTMTLRERAEIANYNKSHKPGYPAEIYPAKGRGIEIHCGHDPYFIARLVCNLMVEWKEPWEKESVTWVPYGGGNIQCLSRPSRPHQISNRPVADSA
jgi:hypothetical protein